MVIKPFAFTLGAALALSTPVQARDFVQIKTPTTQIPPHFLKDKVDSFLSEAGEVQLPQLTSRIKDMYLQRGNPNVEIQIRQNAQGVDIFIDENVAQPVVVSRLKISGGTPQQRYITWLNLKEHSSQGKPYQDDLFRQEISWIEKNHFIPLTVVFKSAGPGDIQIDVDILNSQGLIPTGNINWNDVSGLSLTAGAILFDWPENHLFRAMVKRNNLAFNAGLIEFKSTQEVQDWEHILSWSTGQLPWPGVTFGINQYNKVDYIYPNVEADKNLWIQSLGADFYTGFPIWSNSSQKQYLRGVFNLSLLQDTVNVTPGADKEATEYSQSGRSDDRLILPSLSLIYSDIDDYIIPRNGNLVRSRLSGGFGDSLFGQGTVSAFTFLTPWEKEGLQQTWVFRSAGGTSFGPKQPFYRGFLNTGNWLVRGSREFSVTEKHALRFSQEYHWIYRPERLFFDALSQRLFQQNSQGLLDGWAFDANVFVDEGAYWSTFPTLDNLQASIGIGANARTPAGTLLGFDLAFPVYPGFSGVSFLLRISAPLGFTLYSDWINSNGFFLR